MRGILFSSNEFDIQIANSVEEVGQPAWDYLAAGRPFASYRWYRYGEVASTDRPVYIVLSCHGEPVARATFWLLRQEWVPTPAPLRPLADAFLRRWPLFSCRSPLQASSSGLILPGDPALRDAALATIARVAHEQARRVAGPIIFFDYLMEETAKALSWPEPLKVTDAGDPGTYLPLAWPDFESYLKSLSRSAKKDYHRHCNRAADLGIRISGHPMVTDVEGALALARNVEKHHNSPPTPQARPMLENAGMVDATWLAAEIDHRLVGCGLLLGDEGTYFMTLLGLDYSAPYAYFQLFYEAIHCAIDKGARALRGGCSAYEIKERLGFQLEHNSYIAFMAHTWLLRWVARLVGA